MRGPVATARPLTAPQMPRPCRGGGRDGGGEQGQGQRHHDRGADALDRAGGDERVDAGRERGRGGGAGEDREAHGEEPAAAETVTECGAEHEEDGEGERVRVHRPFQVLQLPPRSSRMAGRAVVTTRLSRAAMKLATPVRTRAQTAPPPRAGCSRCCFMVLPAQTYLATDQ